MIRSVIYFFSLLAINMFSCAILSIFVYNIFCNTHTYIDSSFVLNELTFCQSWSFFFFYIHNSFYFFNNTLELFVNLYNFDTTILNSTIGIFINVPFLVETDVASSYLVDTSLYTTIKFLTRSSNSNMIQFDCLQDIVMLIPSETTLIFFRVFNTTTNSIHCISLYLVHPSNILVYVKKLQCFCFDTILVFPLESVELPVLFFIDSSILTSNHRFQKMYFFYSMIVLSQ